MDGAGHFLGEETIDAALALEPALADEVGRDDLDAKVSLATRPGAGMTAMAVQIIDDGEPHRMERGEPGTDAIGNGHGIVTLPPGGAAVKGGSDQGQQR